MKLLIKIVMYLSSFIPMFLVMLIKELLKIFSNIYDKEYTYKVLLNPLLIGECIFILVLILSIIYLLYNNKKRTVKSYKVIEVNNKSGDYYLQYYTVILLSLINFSLLNMVDLITLTILILLLGIVYIKNDLFFINPTINIFQSMIYELKLEDAHNNIETKLIISKEKIKNNNFIEVYFSDYYNFTFLKSIKK